MHAAENPTSESDTPPESDLHSRASLPFRWPSATDLRPFTDPIRPSEPTPLRIKTQQLRTPQRQPGGMRSTRGDVAASRDINPYSLGASLLEELFKIVATDLRVAHDL